MNDWVARSSVTLRRLRRRVFTPALREVDPERRGFFVWEQDGPGVVVPVGRAFLIGYACMFQEKDGVAAIHRISRQVPAQWRGFAMEGAAMAATVLGGVVPTRRGEFDRFLSAAGERHAYLAYVGLGCALARLPRPLWPRLGRFDPLLSPLVLDGYGFHQVFFHTRSTLARQDTGFTLRRWPGDPDDAVQQLAQGVGRGLWFVGGGNPEVIAEIIEQWPKSLRHSLWAGVGLAATYAGGRGRPGLEDLAHRSGSYLGWLRQGCAFAAEARVRAGLTTEGTRLAVEVLCDKNVDEVAAITYKMRPPAEGIDGGGLHFYEEWRKQVAERLMQP